MLRFQEILPVPDFFVILYI